VSGGDTWNVSTYQRDLLCWGL